MAIREQDTRMTPNNRSYKRAVGVFKNQSDVEAVIRRLKDDSYDMNRVSILARNVDNVEGADELHDETHGNEASEGAGIGASTGTILGGVTGFLIGVGVLAIPGVGPVLAAGAEIGALGSTLAGAGIGAATGGIVGALIGLGIPEDRAKVYESRIKAGDYLLTVSGNDNDVRRAESIMRDRNVEEFQIFDAPDNARPDMTTNYQREDVTVKRPGKAADPSSTVRTGSAAGTNAADSANATKTYDLDNDNKPEVIVIDNRDQDPNNPRI